MGSSQAIGEHRNWRRAVAQPEDFGLKGELVSFNSRDRISIKGWWLSAPAVAHANLVLAHGQDANRSHMLPRASFLVRNGYNVLAIDLRDHGESGGRFISPGYFEAQDILGAVDYLRTRDKGTPVAVLGHSYGGVAALRAAAQSSEIAAVISDGAFASANEVLANVTEHYLNSPETPTWAKTLLWLSKTPGIHAATHIAFYLRTGKYLGPEAVTTLPAVSRIHQPVLFITGELDFISPPENARRMFAAVPTTRKFLLLLPNAGHNSTYKTAPAEYERAVLHFLADSASTANATDEGPGRGSKGGP